MPLQAVALSARQVAALRLREQHNADCGALACAGTSEGNESESKIASEKASKRENQEMTEESVSAMREYV